MTEPRYRPVRLARIIVVSPDVRYSYSKVCLIPVEFAVLGNRLDLHEIGRIWSKGWTVATVYKKKARPWGNKAVVRYTYRK